MRRAAILALGLWIAAGSAGAQVRVLPGAPALSPEVTAALAETPSDRGAALFRLATAGRPDAQTYAGVMLAFNGSDPAAAGKGCEWLAAASATRNDAMHFLGEAYQYGRCGGRVDLEKAISAFHKAGDMGLPKSRCAEGNVLLQLGREETRAVALCKAGAEGGDPDAQTDLANFYLVGKHVPRDVAAARGWYEKAAAQGQRNAAFTLGQIYWNGDGVSRDTATAARHWRAAYAAGRRDAAMYLGDEAMQRAVRKLDGNQAALVVAGKAALDQTILAEAIDWYEKALAAAPPQARAPVEERMKQAKLFLRPAAR